MAKKPDLSGVKDFLFKYGERVGLFTCIGVAVLIIVWGLMGAAGPGTPNGEGWDKTIADAARNLKQKLPLGGEPNPDHVRDYAKSEPFNWQHVDTRANTVPYQTVAENLDTRRTNPLILAVLPNVDEVQNIQQDYVYRGHLGYEVAKNTVLTVVGGGTAADNKGPGALGSGGAVPGGDAGAGGLNLATVLKPRHMMVVTAIFPMKAQVDEFLKALRITSVGELQNNKELPRVLGINVYRDEYVPNVKEPTRKELIVLNKNNELIVDPKLDKDMQEAIYNYANPKSLRPLIHEGLVTPLPKLPEGVKYPALRIKSDHWPKDDLLAMVDDAPPPNPQGGGPGVVPNGMPKGPGILGGMKQKDGDKGNPMGGAEDAKTEFVALKKLIEKDKETFDRLNGTYNIFHPFGQFPDAKDAKDAVERFGFTAPADGNAGGNGAQPAMPGPAGKKPLDGINGKLGSKPAEGPGVGAKPANLEIYDAIARFVDVDLKPGCTYVYHIQVRILNPNFEKHELVAQQNWADIKELTSAWTSTKPFKVPDTFHLFAVDQFLVDKLGNTNPKMLKMLEMMHQKAVSDGNHAVLQLHRWFDIGGARGEFLVGDWAIFEQLVLRKGEPIGAPINVPETVLEIPTWSKGKGSFEMRTTTMAKATLKGVPLDFVPPAATSDGKRIDGIAPLLVDFEGGQKKGGKLINVVDEAAMDVLILTPDGRLIVHNSRADMDAKIKDGTEEGTTRQKRVVEWRERNNAAINPGMPAAKEGGILPK